MAAIKSNQDEFEISTVIGYRRGIYYISRCLQPMNYLRELLIELTSRLPELEWKISRCSSIISNQNIPKGLFRYGPELTGAGCIDEIKLDIETLSRQTNERSANYLAIQIRKKVTVLVTLCQIKNSKNKGEEKISFGIKMLSTRQQWILNLQEDIKTLENQQQAIIKSLKQMESSSNTKAVLSIQGELGEVEKRVTLAKETLKQAMD